MTKALRELSGVTSLKDNRAGHYLARWALSCPLAFRQFSVAFKDLNVGTSSPHTGDAMKRAVEACTGSFLPPTVMCELVLNLSTPKAAWRTLVSYTRSASWSTTLASCVVLAPVVFEPNGNFKLGGRS